jgi:hypothetical protein
LLTLPQTRPEAHSPPDAVQGSPIPCASAQTPVGRKQLVPVKGLQSAADAHPGKQSMLPDVFVRHWLVLPRLFVSHIGVDAHVSVHQRPEHVRPAAQGTAAEQGSPIFWAAAVELPLLAPVVPLAPLALVVPALAVAPLAAPDEAPVVPGVPVVALAPVPVAVVVPVVAVGWPLVATDPDPDPDPTPVGLPLALSPDDSAPEADSLPLPAS